jgi:tetratricopeptide (TPR) repeat protein
MPAQELERVVSCAAGNAGRRAYGFAWAGLFAAHWAGSASIYPGHSGHDQSSSSDFAGPPARAGSSRDQTGKDRGAGLSASTGCNAGRSLQLGSTATASGQRGGLGGVTADVSKIFHATHQQRPANKRPCRPMMQTLIQRSGLLILLLCCAPCCRLWAGGVVVSNTVPDSITNSSPAPGLGMFPTSGTTTPVPTASADDLQKFQIQLDLGKEQRAQKNWTVAASTLAGLLTGGAPDEMKRLALFELALVAQDSGQYVRSEQIFGQYLHTYPEDPSTPEILLRQGLVYRQMGVNTLAISKFYAVMSTALKLKLENMDYYKRLVLQAQIEIADTYYMDGQYDEASDFFRRLLKTADPNLNRVQTQYKLVRALSFTTNTVDVVAQAQRFLNVYTNVSEVPEVRFFLATSLKKLGRNNDSMQQVLMLLQSQQANERANPELWTYWQQRAGNEIAGQLYKEGDYFSALQIYISLADLDKSAAWQLPIWYQTGLIYEQLQQWQKATDTYQHIMDRQKELTDATTTPTLKSLLDMAKWRKDYIEWMQKAKITEQSYVLNQGTNDPSPPQTKQ